MAILAPPSPYVRGALADFSGVNQAVSKLGQALAQARERENMAKIGEAAQGGNLAQARDMAMKGGYLQQGMAFDNRIQQDKARSAAASRRAAADAESRRRFDLTHGLQQQGLDLRRQQLARGPKPTAAEAGYARAQQQGYKGTFLDYQKELKRAGVAAEETQFSKTLGAEQAKYFLQTQREGAKASNDIGQLEVMRNVLSDPNLYQGPGADWVLGVKRALQAAGVKGIRGIESGEMAQSISKKIALAHKGDLPGPLSNSDRVFLESLPANISKTAEGNRWLIELGILNNQYLVDRANAAREYRSANRGRLDAGFYGVQAQISAQYKDKMAELVGNLRSQESAPTRTPDAGFPRITSPEQWQSLPSGTQYLDPDGNTRTKQ